MGVRAEEKTERIHCVAWLDKNYTEAKCGISSIYIH